MGIFGLFRKKKKIEQLIPAKRAEKPAIPLPNQQKITDEQAQRLAQALSQYLKNSK